MPIVLDPIEPDFKKVKKHSLFVKRMKVLLMLGIAANIGAILYTIPFQVIPLSPLDKVKITGDDVIIQDPRFSVGRSFITADEGRINLKTKQATFTGNVKTVLDNPSE